MNIFIDHTMKLSVVHCSLSLFSYVGVKIQMIVYITRCHLMSRVPSQGKVLHQLISNNKLFFIQ